MPRFASRCWTSAGRATLRCTSQSTSREPGSCGPGRPAGPQQGPPRHHLRHRQYTSLWRPPAALHGSQVEAGSRTKDAMYIGSVHQPLGSSMLRRPSNFRFHWSHGVPAQPALCNPSLPCSRPRAPLLSKLSILSCWRRPAVLRPRAPPPPRRFPRSIPRYPPARAPAAGAGPLVCQAATAQQPATGKHRCQEVMQASPPVPAATCHLHHGRLELWEVALCGIGDKQALKAAVVGLAHAGLHAHLWRAGAAGAPGPVGSSIATAAPALAPGSRRQPQQHQRSKPKAAAAG